MESKKSIILIQRHADIIDGRIEWGREELAKEQIWCCSRLENAPEIFLNPDGKFGFPHYKYICGDMDFDYTEEIDFCPYCGKEIDVRTLDPIPRVGFTFIDIDKNGWRKKCVRWENGKIKSLGRRFKTYTLKLD